MHKQLAGMIGRFGDQEMLSVNTNKLDGNGLAVSQLVATCRAMPFLAPVRLVIVTDFLSSKPDKNAVKALAEELPTLPKFTRLVLMESKAVSAKNAVYKAADSAENGYIKAFNKLEGNAIDRWISNEVKARGGQIAGHAANLLATNVGNDMVALDNEVEKLVLYRGEELIRASDVSLLSPYTADANIFELVDAIGNRNTKKAATLLQQSLNDGAEPFYLFAMVVRQFRLLIQTKACSDQGKKAEAISKLVGMPPFVARKMYKQCQYFSFKELKQIYQHLLEIESGVKTGKADLPIALNILVASLAK